MLDESWDGFLGIVAKNAGRLRRAVHRGRNAVGRIALVRPQLPAHASDVDILAAAGFGVNDALAEVNAVRAKRGLRPYIRDEGLTIAAKKVREYPRGSAHCWAHRRFHDAASWRVCIGYGVRRFDARLGLGNLLHDRKLDLCGRSLCHWQ